MMSRDAAEIVLKPVEAKSPPGTFLLRFVNRLRPHLDAGNLVMSFVSNDIHTMLTLNVEIANGYVNLVLHLPFVLYIIDVFKILWREN